MCKVVAIDTTKGGVGKTTTTAALGEYLAFDLHKRVLMVDLDGQATLSRWYNITADPAMCDVLRGDIPMLDITHRVGGDGVGELELAPANGALFSYEYTESGDEALRRALVRPRRYFDVILLDCPPAAGPVVQNALVAADLILMPVQPSALDLFGLDEFLNTLAELHRTGKNPGVQILGVLLVQYHERYSLDRRMKQALTEYGLPVLAPAIPQAQAVREAVIACQSVVRYAPRHQAAQQYRALGEEVARACFPG